MTRFILNNELNGIEIYFDKKPSNEIIDTLKANGFRWHRMKNCWYNKQSEQALNLAQDIVNGNVKNENKKQDDIQTGFKKEPTFNYTGHGWEGINYDIKLDITDIAKLIKKQLKKDFPGAKFSVTVERYSGGQSLTIALMGDIEHPFKDKSTNYAQINHYYIDRDDRLTDRAKNMFKRANELANSFNFQDSDGQIDYFHTNFYLNLKIGKWNKPFKVKESLQAGAV